MNYNFSDLMAAKYMGLSTYPTSKVAHKVCSVIIDRILKHEKRVRARRAKDQATFEVAVGRIIGDLLISASKDGAGWAYRPVSKKSFNESSIKGDTFNNIMNNLCELGDVEKMIGSNRKNPFGTDATNSFYPGIATRFKATKAFLGLCLDNGLKLAQVNKHFKRRPSLKEIRLKASSSRTLGSKIRGRAIKVEQTDATEAIRRRLLEVNKFLVAQNYQGTEFYGLRRIFNEGDHPSFNWNQGGRLYGVGEDNYQLLKKAQRRKIKINGEAVVELDINASYLRILHGLRGFPLPTQNDIYAITGLSRALVKAWVSATLGHTTFHRAWPPRSLADLKKAGVVVGSKMTYPGLMPKVLAHFPVLQDWPDCGVRWSSLMYEEAEAMMSTMETLRYEGVAALPVHDSLIVPKSHGQLAARIIKETFEERFGVDFVVSGLK